MKKREAIKILMLSPFYFKLSPFLRRKLVEEYCLLFEAVSLELNKEIEF